MDNNNTQLKKQSIDHTIILTKSTEDNLKLKKNKVVRGLYVVGGTVSLGLAILGVFLPGLPVTPLALLSAALYAKSSPKLYNWILNNKILGPKIRNYRRRQGVTLKGKRNIIALMALMVMFSSFVVVQYIPLRTVILISGFIGAVVVWFFVPTAKDDPSDDTL